MSPNPETVGTSVAHAPGLASAVGQASAEFALQVAAETWGIPGELQRLPGYVDENFSLEAGGRRFVLKLASVDGGSKDAEYLSFQVAILEHLEAKRVGGAILPRFPKMIRTPAGESVVPLESPEGRRYVARLVEYIEGATFASAQPRSPDLLTSLGATLAGVDNALLDFAHPGDSRYESWDIGRAPDALVDIDAIEDEETRRLVGARLEEFSRFYGDVAGALPKSVIHNDANDNNVIVAAATPNPREVVGLIDFGDAVRTATIFELAIACAYAMLGENDPLDTAKRVVGGYASIRVPTEDELDILLPSIRARLCVSLIMSAKARRDHPDNQYLQVSDQGARELLVALESVHAEWAGHHFREACGLGPATRNTTDKISETRHRLIGRSLSLAYDTPLHIVRGQGTYLYSADGGAFLDCVNNVCHVGHCHPRVVTAAARQMSTLNTNTRYLHEALTEYAALLTATLPAPLTVCYFVNSGSEANDLAIRLARACTGSTGIAVLDHAYHGNLSSLIDISPYKFNGSGGLGKPPHVAVLPIPDLYRGVYRDDVQRYLEEAGAQITTLAESDFGVSAFFAESIAGCAGQVEYPPGYLSAAYDLARNAGALCVADEVQVGFGRVGSHFWGFETQGVVPDIVTMGKPMGNGHPIGAVVTTRAIAECFANGMEYFNTYGGNPVSCVVGAEVLRIIGDEHLQENAQETGKYLISGLRELQRRFPLIGDVRGRGLFLGVELVDDAKLRTPARRQASAVVNRMKEKGVLVSTDGPDHNVIKIKPPITFGPDDADLLLRTLAEVLQENTTQPAATA